MRIKSKMILAVSLLSAALLLVAGMTSFHFFRENIRDTIAHQQFTLVSALAGEVDGKLRYTQEHLMAMAAMVAPGIVTQPEAAQELLLSQQDNRLLFDNGLFLFAADGRLVAAGLDEPYHCLVECPMEEWVQRTLHSGQPQISEPFFSGQESRRPVVLFTAAVADGQGGVAAVLAGSIDLFNDNFLGKLAATRLGQGGYLYLYNQQRTIILHHDHQRILEVLPPGANLLFDRALAGFEGTGETVNSRGLHALSSFKRLSTKDWILAANFPIAEAFAPIDTARRHFLTGTAVLLVLIVPLAWLLTRYQLASLLVLTREVGALREEDEHPAVTVNAARDEIGALAAAFNRLLATTAGHRRAQRQQLRFLQVLLDAIPAPIFYKDAQGRYVGCNRAFEGYIGRRREQLVGKDVFDIAPADLAAIYRRADEELFAKGLGGTQVYEAAVAYADGTRHEVIFYKANFPDDQGQLGGLVGTILDISDRKQAEDGLAAALARQQAISLQLGKLSLAVEQSPNLVVITDTEGTIEYVNQTFCRVTGYTSAEALGRNPRILKGDDTPREYYRTLWETISRGHEWRGEFHNRRKNGESYWESALISPVKNSDGVITHYVAVKEDITEQKVIEQRRQLTAQVLALLSLPSDKTDKVRDILLLLQEFTRCESVAIRLREGEDFPYYRSVGMKPDLLEAENFLRSGEEFADCLCSTVLLGRTDGGQPYFTKSGSFLMEGHSGLAGEVHCARGRCLQAGYRSLALIPLRVGEEVIGLLQLLDRQDDKLSAGLITFLEEIGSAIGIAFGHQQTEVQLQERDGQLQFLTHHDPLTQLPNRILLGDRLRHAMAKAHRSGGKVALLLLDLDRFKTVNDSLGHEVGDRLLVEVAQRLRDLVREVDTLARFSADEFAIVLEEVDDLQKVVVVAQKILGQLSEVICLDDFQLHITASIGIGVFPTDAKEVEGLLKYAETAMYRVKESGRNAYQFYRPEMNARSRELLLLENSLRQALEQQQLILYYQPKIDLGTGALCGAEALLRWRHPELGMVPPADFIPLAEETGLIVPIGAWVLRTACLWARAWEERGSAQVVAVNISGRQFRQADFVDLVAGVLRDTGLSPGLLELEITESMMMEQVEMTIRTLDKLKAMGVRLAIDDFGTGYSSLSYLKRFPIDCLKIDRSFVRELGQDVSSEAIAAAVVALAGTMQLTVVAEGIETMQQQRLLQSLGCGQAQGFLYSHPVPAEEFELLLARIDWLALDDGSDPKGTREGIK